MPREEKVLCRPQQWPGSKSLHHSQAGAEDTRFFVLCSFWHRHRPVCQEVTVPPTLHGYEPLLGLQLLRSPLLGRRPGLHTHPRPWGLAACPHSHSAVSRDTPLLTRPPHLHPVPLGPPELSPEMLFPSPWPQTLLALGRFQPQGWGRGFWTPRRSNCQACFKANVITSYLVQAQHRLLRATRSPCNFWQGWDTSPGALPGLCPLTGQGVCSGRLQQPLVQQQPSRKQEAHGNQDGTEQGPEAM